MDEGIRKAGISSRQVDEHLKLYHNYVKKLDEIREKFENSKKEGNATYSEVRELKIEEGFAWNAIKLHEWYFENIHNEKDVVREVVKEIEEDFGTYENWRAEFVSLASSARGWLILAYDWRDNKLHNFICDAHNQGGIWDTVPLIILDMYEHAYFIDFGTDKAKYIEWFMSHINWKKVEERLSRI